jgi:hypothetical protein
MESKVVVVPWVVIWLIGVVLGPVTVQANASERQWNEEVMRATKSVEISFAAAAARRVERQGHIQLAIVPVCRPWVDGPVVVGITTLGKFAVELYYARKEASGDPTKLAGIKKQVKEEAVRQRVPIDVETFSINDPRLVQDKDYAWVKGEEPFFTPRGITTKGRRAQESYYQDHPARFKSDDPGLVVGRDYRWEFDTLCGDSALRCKLEGCSKFQHW